MYKNMIDGYTIDDKMTDNLRQQHLQDHQNKFRSYYDTLEVLQYQVLIAEQHLYEYIKLCPLKYELPPMIVLKQNQSEK